MTKATPRSWTRESILTAGKPRYQHKDSCQEYHQGDILTDLGLRFRPALALPNIFEQTSALQGRISPTNLLLGKSSEPHCCGLGFFFKDATR